MILLVGGAYQGKSRYARTNYPDRPCFHVQTLYQEAATKGIAPLEYIGQLLADKPQAVLTLDDVGSGIVPIERADRDYREQIGRLGCALAAQAESVLRISCGIGQRLK